ncbi:HD domain-containing protein [Candidatus Woesearchaeota archaeon]|nr:HD domain-containing protein [Candidatus Woesearchaeota archaeon]
MKELARFLFEMGQLQRVRRTGFTTIGVENPHTTSEHSHRTAVIGYFLAKMEGVDAEKVAVMCLFHDMHEARLNDLHKVGHRYINFREAEEKAFREQLESIGKLGSELLPLVEEAHRRESREAEVARDADLLENALEAREYIKIGYGDAQNWIDNIWKVIKTESGKKLLKDIENTDPNEWLFRLKKVER